MSAEAKRMKWQQGSESNELAASLALVDKAVRTRGRIVWRGVLCCDLRCIVLLGSW